MYTGDNYLTEIKSKVLGCERCGLCNTRTNIAIYRGNPRSDIMVISDAPSNIEDKTGIPMKGPSGSMFIQNLELAGLPLSEYFITNIVMCRPSANRNPNANEIESCSYWLSYQLEQIKPKIVITVGRIAASTLIPETKSMKMNQIEGKLFKPYLFDFPLIPVLHPSYILRNPSRESSYIVTLKNVVAQCKRIIET